MAGIPAFSAGRCYSANGATIVEDSAKMFHVGRKQLISVVSARVVSRN